MSNTTEPQGILESQISQIVLDAYSSGRSHGIEAGVAAEKRRIIELLEANREPCDCGDACEQFDAGFNEAIALIKGENK